MIRLRKLHHTFFHQYENLESDSTNLGPVASPSSTITTSSSTSPPSSASPSSVPEIRSEFRSSTIAPSLLKFPGDGALLMPEVPDSDDEYEDENEPVSRTILAQPLRLPAQAEVARKRVREQGIDESDDEEEEEGKDDQYMEQETAVREIVVGSVSPAKKTRRN